MLGKKSKPVIVDLLQKVSEQKLVPLAKILGTLLLEENE